MSDDGDSIWDTLLNCWWGQILIGIFFFAIAGFLYWYISDLEATGRGGRAPCLVAVVYNIAGKWGSVLLFVVPGIVIAGVGIRNLITTMRGDDR
jgi:hypothetical protein